MSPRAVLVSLLLCLPPSLPSPPSPPSPGGPARRSGCFKVSDCKCIMKDGSGVINLKAMGDADGFLGRWTPLRAAELPAELPAGAEALLSFSPCLHFSQPDELPGTECSNVAVCLVVRLQGLSVYSSRYVNYGRHEGNQFHYNDSIKTLSVSYYAHEEWPLSVVHFHCNPNQSASIIREQRLGVAGPLQIWVESPCACPNACAMGDLGLGTIFLIILSLSAAAYFILGSCALRAFRSRSSGVQMSPEHSVWCMICYLCSERRPDRRQYEDASHAER